MIRKLRIKLIIASMVSLFTVLLIVMGTISLLDYRGVIEDADQVGTYPWQKTMVRFPISPAQVNVPRKTTHEKRSVYFPPSCPMNPATVSVFLNQSGQPIATNTGKIKAVDTSTAIAYAQSIWESGRTSGFSSDYRYMVYAVQDETHMLFRGLQPKSCNAAFLYPHRYPCLPWQGLFQYCFYCCSCPGES